MSQLDFLNTKEQSVADKLLNKITNAGSDNIDKVPVAEICRAYESLCNAAAIRHGALMSCPHLKPTTGKTN